MNDSSLFNQAEAYERYMGRWSRLLAPPLLTFADVQSGDRVLDVGSGTGAVSHLLRDSTTAARIIGVDASDQYVTHATRENRDPRLSFQVGNAQQLNFGDATFDRCVSLLVFNFIADPARALGELMRVTKPGGSVCAAVWDYGGGMTMLRAFWDAACKLSPEAEAKSEAHVPLGQEGNLKALWQRAGLDGVQEESLNIEQSFASFDDFWGPFELGQGRAGHYVKSLGEPERHALRDLLCQRLFEGAPERPLQLRARAWAVKGVVV